MQHIQELGYGIMDIRHSRCYVMLHGHVNRQIKRVGREKRIVWDREREREREIFLNYSLSYQPSI